MDASVQRRLAKMSRDQANRRYSDLYDLAPIPYLSFNRTGRIAECNLAAAQLFKMARRRMIGMPFMVFVSHEDTNEFLTHLMRCRGSDSRVETELRLKDINHKVLHAYLSSAPAINERHDASAGLYHTAIVDLTPRHRAEEARAEALRQQGALYELSQRHQRAESVQEIYEAALDAIAKGLPCERASILLYDEHHVMRFVAWRRLSEKYRKAVEGHAPWKRGVKSPRPICIPDVRCADIPETLKKIILNEGIRAIAFIPVVSDGRLIGKIMTYHDVAHVFTDSERQLATTIAGQLAQAIEHKRDEVALLQKEAELETIVTKTPFMLTRCTRDLRYRYVSRAYAEMVGRTPDEIAGRSIVEVLGKGGLATIRPYLDRVLRGETVTYEMIVPFKHTGPHFLSTAYVPDKNERGEVVGWFASIADITERKKADERFRLAVEASPSGMIMMDQEGKITLVNSQAEQLFGYTREELLGKSIDIVIPKGFPLHRAKLASVPKAKAMGSERDLFALRKDGTEVPIEIGLNPIRSGKTTVILSSIVDITERKHAEQHLRIRDAVSRALAESVSMKKAAPRIIQAICNIAGWETGALWDINEPTGNLFCVDFWHQPSVKVPAFEEATRRMTYPVGTGLPGRVWVSGKAIWVPDITRDDSFPRARFAMQNGLHAAVSFPIKLENQVLGTVECFTRKIRPLDEEMLEMLSLIGSQMGQFVQRKKAEEALAEANRQRAALYDFAQRCQNVKSFDEIYDAALDAIVPALQCDRASILLYDEQEVMRFAAWRGLSARYREAVEGHSPWEPDTKNPQLICVSDVELADLPNRLKQTILREKIRAAAFIPLVSDGKLIGKFMAYHRVPHVFDDGELKLAATIAQHLGQAIEHKRDEDALLERERLLARELQDQKQLQRISSQLIEQQNIEITYSQIVEATVALVRSDMGSLQMFVPETGDLVLLAQTGFHPASTKAWQRLAGNDRGTTCAEACRRAARVIVPDLERCDLITNNKKDLAAYRQSGIRAVQSTPLTSRTGEFLGMISTHWREVHEPSARELRLLDVMARQAADLIEWKRSDDEVRESEARMRATVEQATAGVGSCDMRGRIVFANRTLCQMLGYNESELIGKTIADVTHPDDAKENVALFARLIRKGKPFDIEKRYVRKNGSILWGHVSVSPVRDAAGEIKSAVAVAVDVTARKEAEASLQKSKQLLEQRVRGRTHELRKTNKKLQSEIERRKGLEGEILSVSDREQQRLGQELHDGLCQHLTAVAFMTRSIALRLRDHRVVEAADIEKVAELVNKAAVDTRNLSRALHRVDVDAAGLIVALQDLADREIWRTPCRLEVKPSFRIDDDGAAAHLFRIAREAVINANKHAQARQIVVKLERVRKEMVLRVIDDGIGLPKEVRPQQGLGFHIMNYRAQLMGGRVEMDSLQTGGTRVSCYLPLCAAQSNKASNADRPNGAMPKNSAIPVAGDLNLRHLARRGAANA